MIMAAKRPIKLRFVLTLVFSISGIVSGVLYYFLGLDFLHSISFGALLVGNLAILGYLYRAGTLVRSRWANMAYLPVSLYILAVLFMIQHWAGATILILCCWGLLMLLYTIWFSIKPKKELPDVLKWLWLILSSTSTFTQTLHWQSISRDYPVSVLLAVLLVIAYILVYRKPLSTETIELPTWDFDKARDAEES